MGVKTVLSEPVKVLGMKIKNPVNKLNGRLDISKAEV